MLIMRNISPSDSFPPGPVTFYDAKARRMHECSAPKILKFLLVNYQCYSLQNDSMRHYHDAFPIVPVCQQFKGLPDPAYQIAETLSSDRFIQVREFPEVPVLLRVLFL